MKPFSASDPRVTHVLTSKDPRIRNSKIPKIVFTYQIFA